MLLVSVPNGLAFFLKSPQAGLHLKHEISKQLSCMGTHSDDGRTQAGRVRFENYFWLMVHAQCELLSQAVDTSNMSRIIMTTAQDLTYPYVNTKSKELTSFSSFIMDETKL